jgi:hypothetical protein
MSDYDNYIIIHYVIIQSTLAGAVIINYPYGFAYRGQHRTALP